MPASARTPTVVSGSTRDVRRFAYRQGPGRTLLNPPVEVEDDAPTTAVVAPRGARGRRGILLPAGNHELLEKAPFPAWPAVSGAPLEHVLLSAFGLQRREPSNAFNDHRVVASVRSKFPVHVFVVPPNGAACYLDLYRHALVELDPVDVPAEIRPEPGRTTVVLSARYTDLPTGYTRLRAALTELEIGVNLRALFDAADLFGVSATLLSDGATCQAAARLVAATGTGAWGPPVLVVLDGAMMSTTVDLPSSGQVETERDALLDELGGHWSVREAADVTSHVYELCDEPDGGGHGLPADPGGVTTRPSWARVLWQRTAGRAPKGVSGFTATPCRVGAECLEDMVRFASVPAPSPLLREVASRVRVTVAVQRAGELPTGVYRLADADPRLVRTDPSVMEVIQRQFGYPLSPLGACGIRHATAVWVLSTDVEGLVDDLGPGGWTLLQRCCGWVSHGICTAAAAHGLFARPARSFDEHALGPALAVPAGDVPVFITVCGRGQFAEPALDLRI